MNPPAELYSRYCNAQQKWAREILKLTKFQAKTYHDILDIGCGTGEVTNIVLDTLQDVKHIIAYDKFENMVDFAQSYHSRPEITYAVADAENPESMKSDWSGRFNLAVSFLVFHWVNDQSVALRMINSMLSPGGEFLLAFGVRVPAAFLHASTKVKELAKWSRILKDFVPPWRHSKGWEKNNAWRTPDPVAGYQQLVKDADMNIIGCEVRKFNYIFKSDNDCRGMVQTLMPHTLVIADEDMDEFMDDVLELYKEKSLRTEDGRLVWDADLLLVHGQKPSKDEL